MIMKIGIFGGNFDPVHLGHIKVAETVLNELDIDEVWFIPAGKHPDKDDCMFSYEKRLQFLTKSIIYNPKFKVLDIDKNDNQKSYTIKLIQNLMYKFPDYYFSFIIGADNVTKLKNWREYKKLLDIIEFIVIDRNINDKDDWLSLDYLSKLKFLKMPNCDISSSMIRKKLQSDESVKEFLCESAYISIYNEHTMTKCGSSSE